MFEEQGIQILNGRYGPYVTDGNKNVKVPKDQEPVALTLEECVKMIAEAPEKKTWDRGKKAAAKKAPEKKTATKKRLKRSLQKKAVHLNNALSRYRSI